MTWAHGPLLGLDLESTSVDPLTALPVAFALVWFHGEEVTKRRYGLIDCGEEIPAEAVAVHGITTEECSERGGSLEDSVLGIATAVMAAGVAGEPVVGANLRFDLSILDSCLRRMEDSEFGEPVWGGLRDYGWSGPVIDVMVIDRAVDKWRKGSRKLSDLCKHYEVDPGRSHHAGSDAEAAVRVALKIAEKYPVEVGELDLDLLHVQQAAWRREWVQSFNQYRVTKGEPPIPESEANWPLATDERISA